MSTERKDGSLVRRPFILSYVPADELPLYLLLKQYEREIDWLDQIDSTDMWTEFIKVELRASSFSASRLRQLRDSGVLCIISVLLATNWLWDSKENRVVYSGDRHDRVIPYFNEPLLMQSPTEVIRQLARSALKSNKAK